MDLTLMQSLPWFTELVADVEKELERRRGQKNSRRPAIEQEIQQLDAQIKGWRLSLGNPELDSSVREMIEEDLRVASSEKCGKEVLLAQADAEAQQAERFVDPQLVVDRINRLGDVLASSNPSLGNLELSMHIDRIDCFQDGRVIMRTCRLGILADAIEMFADNDSEPSRAKSTDVADSSRVKPRRREKLRIDDWDPKDGDVNAARQWAADPNRFAGLGEEWFEEQEFCIPEKMWPYKAMAIEVATQRLAGLTHEELAEKFGVTAPTIRKSLRHASKMDGRFRNLPRKMARARWHEDKAMIVAAKKAEGLGTDELVAFFSKSDTTIRKALVHAAKLRAESSNPPISP